MADQQISTCAKKMDDCVLTPYFEDIIFVTKLTSYMREQIELVLCMVTEDIHLTLIDLSSDDIPDSRRILNKGKTEFRLALQNLTDRVDTGEYEIDIIVEKLITLTGGYTEFSYAYTDYDTKSGLFPGDISSEYPDYGSEYYADQSNDDTQLPTHNDTYSHYYGNNTDDQTVENKASVSQAAFVSEEEYNAFYDTTRAKKAFILLQGSPKKGYEDSLSYLSKQNLTKSWLSSEIITPFVIDERSTLSDSLAKHVSQFNMFDPRETVSYVDYIHSSICETADLEPVETGLDKSVQLGFGSYIR